MTTYTIGDVSVTDANASNPYGCSLIGNERQRALVLWKLGRLPAQYAIWYAPCHGGAVRLTDPAKVDWQWLEHGLSCGRIDLEKLFKLNPDVASYTITPRRVAP